MSHDGSHWTQTIKQFDANGVEHIVGVTCFVCDKTWWTEKKVTA